MGLPVCFFVNVDSDILTLLSNSFMENLERILSPDYIPTFQDITKSRLRTTGITETVFNTPGYNYRVFDVGGTRSERKKWIHCFDKVDIILFQVSLGGYDKCLIEDREQVSAVLKLSVDDQAPTYISPEPTRGVT